MLRKYILIIAFTLVLSGCETYNALFSYEFFAEGASDVITVSDLSEQCVRQLTSRDEIMGVVKSIRASVNKNIIRKYRDVEMYSIETNLMEPSYSMLFLRVDPIRKGKIELFLYPADIDFISSQDRADYFDQLFRYIVNECGVSVLHSS